jgi:hypothetical protein
VVEGSATPVVVGLLALDAAEGQGKGTGWACSLQLRRACRLCPHYSGHMPAGSWWLLLAAADAAGQVCMGFRAMRRDSVKIPLQNCHRCFSCQLACSYSPAYR